MKLFSLFDESIYFIWLNYLAYSIKLFSLFEETI